MLKPIPLKVLIDTATLSKLVTGARGKTYSPDTALGNVLIQNKKIRTKVNENILTTSDAILFYDVTHSTGGPTFAIGDRVTYADGHGNSHEKYIKSIVEAKTHEGIHHYEVMLL